MTNKLNAFNDNAVHGVYSSMSNPKASRNESLTQVFTDTQKAVMEALLQPTGSLEDTKQCIHTLIENTQKLKKQYEGRTGSIVSRIFNKETKKTLHAANDLIREATSVEKILEFASKNELTQAEKKELEKTLKTFIGKDINKLKQFIIIYENRKIENLKEALIKINTNFVIHALSNKKSPTDVLQLPYINFSELNEDNLDSLYSIIIENYDRISEKGGRIRSALLSIGTTLKPFSESKAYDITITGILLSKFTYLEILNIRNKIKLYDRSNFTKNLHELIKLNDCGFLCGEKEMENFDDEFKLHFRSRYFPGSPPPSNLSFHDKVNAYTIRLHRMECFSNVEEAIQLKDSFLQLENYLKNPKKKMNADELAALYVIMDSYKSIDYNKRFELAYFFPELKEILDVHSNAPEFQLLKFVDEYKKSLSLPERLQLLHLCSLDVLFPRPLCLKTLKAIKTCELAEDLKQLVYKKYPLVRKAETLLLNNLDNKGSLSTMASFNCLIFAGNIHEVDDPAFEQELLLPSKKPSSSPCLRFGPIKIIPSIETLDLTGKGEVDNEWLDQFQVPQNCKSIDLTGTSVTADKVLAFQKKHPNLQVIFEDLLSPFKSLLESGVGDYALPLPGNNTRMVSEKLLRAVAKADPQLEEDEVKPFLEFCYTGQLPVISDDLLARLWVKAEKQGWQGMGEYCAARLIGSTKDENVISLWELAKEDPSLEPLRQHCVQYMFLHCQKEGIVNEKFSKNRNVILTAIREIVNEPVLTPEPPLFNPPKIDEHFPLDFEMLDQEGKPFKINLELFAAHSGFFKGYKNWPKGQEPLSLKNIHRNHLALLDRFFREGTLPRHTLKDLKVLVQLAYYLDIPSLKVTVIAELHQIELERLTLEEIKTLNHITTDFELPDLKKVLIAELNNRKPAKLSLKELKSMAHLASDLELPDLKMAVIAELKKRKIQKSTLKEFEILADLATVLELPELKAYLIKNYKAKIPAKPTLEELESMAHLASDLKLPDLKKAVITELYNRRTSVRLEDEIEILNRLADYLNAPALRKNS